MPAEPKPVRGKTLPRALSRLGASMRTLDLPPELLGRAIGRLRVVSWVLASIATIYTVIVNLVRLGVIDATHHISADEIAQLSPRFHAVMGATLLLAGGVLAATYWKQLAPQRISALALVLEIGGALCIASAERPVSMMAAHAHTTPRPPTRRTELPIPRELEEIVLSLLAKDPAARPQSAAELARRLADVPIASPWTQDRADRWWQSHLPHLLRETTIEAETAALATA
jgi:hypothetical protein